MSYTVKLISFICIAVFCMSACNTPSSNLEPLDLLPYGLPMKILAPPGSEVNYDDMGILKDVTIKGDDNYYIQIFASETNTLNTERILSEIRSTITEGQFFSQFMKEDDGGFIFEKKVDEDYINYDFRYVKIRGDQKYLFQTGISGKYSLEDVESMYEAVQ